MLSPFYEPQQRGSFCALASCAIVMNALTYSTAQSNNYKETNRVTEREDQQLKRTQEEEKEEHEGEILVTVQARDGAKGMRRESTGFNSAKEKCSKEEEEEETADCEWMITQELLYKEFVVKQLLRSEAEMRNGM